MDLSQRLEELGRSLAEREVEHAEACARAERCARDLHQRVAAALARFETGAGPLGSRLRISLAEPRVDDKHLRAVEFELSRGRHRAIVTVKSRGEVTLVGPFHAGKTEGPCRTFSIDANAEIEAALGDFLVGFIEEAATP